MFSIFRSNVAVLMDTVDGVITADNVNIFSMFVVNFIYDFGYFYNIYSYKFGVNEPYKVSLFFILV